MGSPPRKRNRTPREQNKTEGPTRVAIACQGGGIHAAFEVGVLTEILKDMRDNRRFEVMGLSGTSAGALCALMVWYGLASKGGRPGSESKAIECLESFWDSFAATGFAEKILNRIAYSSFLAREAEAPVFGLSAPAFGLNPRGAISQAFTAALPLLGVREQYYDLDALLKAACPEFDRIDWDQLKTRLLVGATEVLNGIETVFDSDCNTAGQQNKGTLAVDLPKLLWRERVPLSLEGIAASGTLPELRQAERINGRCYWDGLYSLNPPIREFWEGVGIEFVPNEIWVLRINPQQCQQEPESNADIQDRQNELMGNLSLNKELDFILHMNKWSEAVRSRFNMLLFRPVKVRTIKMKQATCAALRYSSKFDRSPGMIDRLRSEGHEVAREWLAKWDPSNEVDTYPDDAGFSLPPQSVFSRK